MWKLSPALHAEHESIKNAPDVHPETIDTSSALVQLVSGIKKVAITEAAVAHFLGFRTGAGAVVAHFLIRGRPQTEGQIRRGWICVKYHET